MKKQVGNRSRPKNLVLKTYGYEQWFNKESDCEKEIVGTPSMPPQEGNQAPCIINTSKGWK